MNYWLVRGDPRENDFGAFMVPGSTDTWRTMQPPKGWTPGDRVFFWASSPQLELLGLGVFLGATGRKTPEGESTYSVRYETGIADRPLTISELRADPIVAGAIFLRRGPASSVTRLTPDEGVQLYRLLTAVNPPFRRVWPDINEAIVGTIGPHPEDLAFAEGRPELVEHLRRERARHAILAKKRHVKAETGRLACEVCDFDFEERYGALGSDFCEVHHRVPMAGSDELRQTRLRDLAVVCSNCHRILHRTNPMMSTEELRSHYRRGA